MTLVLKVSILYSYLAYLLSLKALKTKKFHSCSLEGFEELYGLNQMTTFLGTRCFIKAILFVGCWIWIGS